MWLVSAMPLALRFTQVVCLLWLVVLEAAPRLDLEVTPEGMCVFRWSGSGVLETAHELNGGWSVVPGAVSGWQVAPGSGRWFFRLREPVVEQGVLNGDFEEGPGVGWGQDPGNMIYTAEELGLTPYSGNYAAWVGFHPDSRRWATLSQAVTLPESWPVYLNFALWLYSEELCDPPWWDTFGVYVNGVAIVENTHLCAGNTGGDGWRRVSLDVSPFAGQTVQLAFEISSIDALASVALVDLIFLSDRTW